MDSQDLPKEIKGDTKKKQKIKDLSEYIYPAEEKTTKDNLSRFFDV